MFSEALLKSSYRPKTGLAAASTEERLFKTVVIPAWNGQIKTEWNQRWIRTSKLAKQFVL